MTTRKPLWKRVRSRYRCYRITVGRLTSLDWRFVRFKLSLGLVWPTTFFASSPESLVRTTGVPFMMVWLICCTLGFFISITGLVMSAQRGDMRRRGFRIELGGLYLFLAGPCVYALLQLVVLAGQIVDGADGLAILARLAQLSLAYALSEAILARTEIVKGGLLKTLNRGAHE